MQNTQTFLFEIGVEELPSQVLQDLANSLIVNLQNELQKVALAHGTLKAFVTPRRLAILINDLVAKQKDQIVEAKGPAVAAAFKDGRPTPAAVGFAKSLKVEVEALDQIETEKGSYLVYRYKKVGAKVAELMPQVIVEAFKKLPLPKLMRWGESEFAFIRPIQWVLMLYGNKVIEEEIFGIKSSNKTYGHRFHSPKAIIINDSNDYEVTLKKVGKVIPDFSERRELIREQIMLLVAKLPRPKNIPIIDDALLDEVTGLVEYPEALLCSFEKEFLELPEEVLFLVLQKQQRYFPIVTPDNKITNKFIVISNIASKKPQNVIKGNENVIRARLRDAEFFYNSDLKFTLQSYNEKLKNTLFQADLGSIYDKSLRLGEIVFYLAKKINANEFHAKRSAELAKADLMTTMVGEFPELQGTIGHYYALKQNEPAEVAIAIKEHYWPRFAIDALPSTEIGSILSIADRIDTLVGTFSINKNPVTGTKDPFGLRRAVIGLLRIILGNKYDLDLQELLQGALDNYLNRLETFDDVITKTYQVPSQDQTVKLGDILNRALENIKNFVFERMRNWYADLSINNNIFTAVLNVQSPTSMRFLDFDKRIFAVQKFLQLSEAEALIAAHKRVKNILKAQDVSRQKFDLKLATEVAEKTLAAELAKKTLEVSDLCNKNRYQEALTLIADLKLPIDNFFDQVMVMVDDVAIRNNRLQLLADLNKLFNSVADISCL